MPIDNLITRYPNGVNNRFDNDVFANLKMPDCSIYHLFYEDFDQYTAAQWVLGGVGTPVAPALVAGDGGLLSLATSAADNDNNWIQQAATAWTFTPGKKLFFRARVAAIDSSTECDIALGLQVAVAANEILIPTDGVFLRKADNISNFVLVSRVGGVETISTQFGPIVSPATPFEVSLAYDGQGNILGSLNGQVSVSITPAALTAVPLRITAGVQAGNAAVRTMLLDQLVCYKER